MSDSGRNLNIELKEKVALLEKALIRERNAKKRLEVQLDERFPEIQELYKMMNNYIEIGISNSGKMPLSNSNKDIQYIFSIRKNVNCQVNLIVRQ